VRAIAQKVGEEGVETALAAVAQDDEELAARPPTCCITCSYCCAHVAWGWTMPSPSCGRATTKQSTCAIPPGLDNRSDRGGRMRSIFFLLFSFIAVPAWAGSAVCNAGVVFADSNGNGNRDAGEPA
jgi:hypothetical protein